VILIQPFLHNFQTTTTHWCDLCMWVPLMCLGCMEVVQKGCKIIIFLGEKCAIWFCLKPNRPSFFFQILGLLGLVWDSFIWARILIKYLNQQFSIRLSVQVNMVSHMTSTVYPNFKENTLNVFSSHVREILEY
jgi:hypothetical protein